MSPAAALPEYPASNRRGNRLNLCPIPRADNLTSSEFQSLFTEPLRPVILRKFASSWPASTKWTPDFFKEKYGSLQVKVHNASFVRPGKHYMSSFARIPFQEYLDLMISSSLDLRMFAFNILRNAPELKRDIVFPPIANGFSKNLIFMFFGCKGSVTSLHYDPDIRHLFHTVLYGKKRVMLFANEESKNLYKHPFNTRSYVDVGNPDFEKFPKLKDVTGYEDVIYPGETLFIPSGYWHYVVYEEGGYGVCIRSCHSTLTRRVRRYINLLVFFPVDKIMNMLFSDRWFRLKERMVTQKPDLS